MGFVFFLQTGLLDREVVVEKETGEVEEEGGRQEVQVLLLVVLEWFELLYYYLISCYSHLFVFHFL